MKSPSDWSHNSVTRLHTLLNCPFRDGERSKSYGGGFFFFEPQLEIKWRGEAKKHPRPPLLQMSCSQPRVLLHLDNSYLSFTTWLKCPFCRRLPLTFRQIRSTLRSLIAPGTFLWHLTWLCRAVWCTWSLMSLVHTSTVGYSSQSWQPPRLECDKCQLTCAACVKYTLELQDSAWQE